MDNSLGDYSGDELVVVVVVVWKRTEGYLMQAKITRRGYAESSK